MCKPATLFAQACTNAIEHAITDVNKSVQAGFRDIESATRLAWKYMMDSGDLLKGLQARQAFLDFMELNSASHPIPR